MDKEQIQIGEYVISRDYEGALWITHISGEGGSFDEKLLSDLIGQFYSDNF